MIERLFMRVVFLFLQIERSHCGDPECHCKAHEVVSPTPFAWYSLFFWMGAWLLYALCWGRR